MGWRGRAGVDALSFGFVKNGGMSSEALIFFKPELADATLIRRKRAGLLFSKGRYQAAQLLALLEDDLWLANGRAANAGAAMLGWAATRRERLGLENRRASWRDRASRPGRRKCS